MKHTLDLQQVSFDIILHAGNARSSAMEALQLARREEIEQAYQKIKEAEEKLNQAHHSQTALLQQEASGAGENPSILLIHAQDHLMNAMTVKELGEEMIELYKRGEGEK
ncbi:PTS lactose/cellobiose transporter subunit IIA [Salibacterium halotolerans]|uniref:PTS system, cellobiose-specific IIA component n=1 Tax=Salibacterium halotolerans TaxID=1884432 RepID=A0A1I5V4T7_9BACI|nr:PTS lactose/cellobiose transporter subunit IIA [Salibacterium halotolerans]SFQ02529.1 PTS system, cellobiose-specific IIA component [Salibacterium halotolerans]